MAKDIYLNYTPHHFQKLIHDDQHRFKSVIAGRRFGKSTFARWHIIWKALRHPGRYWIVSPTIKQGKTNHWTAPEGNILLDTEEIRTYKNDTELAVEISGNEGKSRIELLGAENIEKTRGAGLKGVVLDEAADLSHYIWKVIIAPMLVDSGGWAILIGTPKGHNWLEKMYNQGKRFTKVEETLISDKKGKFPVWHAKILKKPMAPSNWDGQWASFRFTSYDNPTIDPRFIDSERVSALAEGKEDWFYQEYLADFRKVHGLIYDKFDREVHLLGKAELPPLEDMEIYRGLDFGFDNPTVVNWMAVGRCECGEEIWYLIDEYHEEGQTSEYHIGMILAKDAEFPASSQGIRVQAGFADPTAAQQIKDWGEKGLYLTPARRDPNTNLREWVGHGIDLIKKMLSLCPITHKPHLFITPDCPETTREFETYTWKEEKDENLNKPGRPEKANDHHLDALRYFAVSWRGTKQFYLPKDTRDWSIVGKL